jgi:hypothetical protein
MKITKARIKNLLKDLTCDTCIKHCARSKPGHTCERHVSSDFIYEKVASPRGAMKLNGRRLYNFTNPAVVKGIRIVDHYDQILAEFLFNDGPYHIPEGGGSITCILNIQVIKN